MKKKLVSSPRIQLLLKIYLLGRKITSIVKKKNSDLLSKALILAVLGDEAMSVSQLASELSVKPSAMSEKLSIMENEGLILRQIHSDARLKTVKIANKGCELMAQVIDRIENSCVLTNKSIKADEAMRGLKILNKIELSV